ncbi:MULTISPECIES: molybdenum cofactor guanylyltransferase MobA [Zoogloea]|uniref:Molybdenum cofactor guanylyltransferase n=1 Tax=Zoogloea oryzae TaxID=310767 RepID=A0ABQ6FAK2_9RHOO|nr:MULTISPECIES: molybdenum cofactor guanylyltransferase MobA [Zoogloea]GLT22582.1 molybdenum cofactor guanylyltransferase [Zoogloea oryzae]
MIPASPENITGLILAGGRGSRMGGVDKGLALLDGRPMVSHVLDRLAPQVGPILISANRSTEHYAMFGRPVIPDRLEGFAGPLAGLEAGLAACTTPYLATAPCDSPFLPPDLVPRLAEALCAERASVAVARTGDQLQPVFALMRSFALPDLQAFTRAGGRKMELWLRRLKWVACPFDDAPDAFANINTPDELRAHQAGDFPR